MRVRAVTSHVTVLNRNSATSRCLFCAITSCWQLFFFKWNLQSNQMVDLLFYLASPSSTFHPFSKQAIPCTVWLRHVCSRIVNYNHIVKNCVNRIPHCQRQSKLTIILFVKAWYSNCIGSSQVGHLTCYGQWVDRDISCNKNWVDLVK